MAIDNLNDGVGKKIVEALMMQSAEPTDENMITEEEPEISESYSNEYYDDNDNSTTESTPNDMQQQIQSQLQFQVAAQNSQINVDNAFNESLAKNLGGTYMAEEYDYPPNVAIIKQLVAKLPAGVTHKTGAIIIKQTMEALGISMSSVLQEAKQVQETLRQNSKDCQTTIAEYKKQISILENKSHQYQRQAAGLTDIITLFIQTR